MLTSKISGDDKLVRQLRALSLPKNRKKQLNTKLAREIIKQSKIRTRQQIDMQGNKFTPRKNGKRKMLTKIMRHASVVRKSSKNASVGWKNSLIGKVARAQQEGHSVTMTPNKMQKRKGRPDYNAPATKVQAKALVQAGYKRRVKGKYKSGQNAGKVKTKRVSQKWITENMTLGHAAIVLRLMRDEPSKQSWQVNTPARPFFGADKGDIKAMAAMVIDEFTQGIKRA